MVLDPSQAASNDDNRKLRSRLAKLLATTGKANESASTSALEGDQTTLLEIAVDGLREHIESHIKIDPEVVEAAIEQIENCDHFLLIGAQSKIVSVTHKDPLAGYRLSAAQSGHGNLLILAELMKEWLLENPTALQLLLALLTLKLSGKDFLTRVTDETETE